MASTFNFSDFTFPAFTDAKRRTVSFEPTTIAGLVVVSIFTAFVYSLVVDIGKAYNKAPKTFPLRGPWLYTFSKKRVDVPLVELNDKGDYREALERGAKLHPNKPFKVPHHPNEWVIVPHNMINEVKDKPEAKLSFQQGSYDFFMGWHTGITNHERAVAMMLRGGINRLIDVCYAVVQDESLRTVLENIGECEEWTEMALLPKTVNMIMAISQRVFVGEPLCRNEQWLHSIVEVTQNAFGAVPSLWESNPITRPLIAWRNPHLRSVRQHRDRAKQLLRPYVNQRLKDMESPDFKPPPDLMQFIMDATKKTGEGRSVDYQVNAIIGTGRAALFTTGITIYHLMYDLCRHPEVIEPLREEIRQMGDIPMNRANVQKMAKMDSFIRESQRFTKFMLVGTLRKVMSDFTLSDGTHLPAGTYLGTNVHDAIFNHSTLENPEKFDAFRFERLRSIPGNENMYQSVQLTPDHLVYGMGSQACPGRFFARHEACVVVARLIMNYDFKLAEPEKAQHPMRNADGILTTVDPSVKFLFKRRVPN